MKPLAVLLLCLVVVHSAVGDDNWPQFRGRAGNGIGAGNPPVTWNVTDGTNVAWHTAIPGLGHSCPIVWGDRVFLTTAVSTDTDQPTLETGWLAGSGKSAEDTGEWTWQVLCLQLSTGNILWTKDATSGSPKVQRHLKASHANATPVTDGRHIVAFFGSEGLHCFDFDGKLIWQQDFGRLHSGPYDATQLEWGFASSPIIDDGKVIVQCDCLNTAFIAILDVATGKEIRRIDREGEVSTWSTPLIVNTNGRKQIVCNGYHQMAGYDLNSGERLWYLSGGGDVPVPTPLFDNGLIYLTNGHGRAPAYAVRPSATGDISPETKEPTAGLEWWQPTGGAYIPTPLVKDGLLYTCSDNGRLAVRDALTGDLIYRQRVGSGSRTYSASAVAAGGRLYFASERGEVTVVSEGREFVQVAQNEMGEVTLATPAISEDRLLIRTIRELFCLQREQPSVEETN